MKNKIVCKDCGLVLDKPHLDLYHQFTCPRCDSTIYKFGQNHTTIILLAITSLILFLPAIFLPLLSLKIGDEQTATIIDAVFIFSDNGYLLLSVFITFIGVVSPFLILILILVLLTPLKAFENKQRISRVFKIYKFLQEWQMAEVYLISIFIAIIKLQSMAELNYGIGLFFFFGFLFFMFVTMVLFNPYDIWSEDEVSNR